MIVASVALDSVLGNGIAPPAADLTVCKIARTRPLRAVIVPRPRVTARCHGPRHEQSRRS